MNYRLCPIALVTNHYSGQSPRIILDTSPYCRVLVAMIKDGGKCVYLLINPATIC